MTERPRFDTIRTDRLTMRRWRITDREPFADLNADPETMKFLPGTLDRAASDALIYRIESRFSDLGFGLWALEITQTGEFIGFTGLSPMPDGVPGAGGMEVGWRLARRAWHHGYATEAARAAVDVAFGGVGLTEVWSMTAVLNKPSQAVMRRLGLTEVARFGHPMIEEGHPLRPHVTYHLARGGPGRSVLGFRRSRAHGHGGWHGCQQEVGRSQYAQPQAADGCGSRRRPAAGGDADRYQAPAGHPDPGPEMDLGIGGGRRRIGRHPADLLLPVRAAPAGQLSAAASYGGLPAAACALASTRLRKVTARPKISPTEWPAS
jgi:RimJ/RimL family protein N-acetyltransferase